MFVHPHLHLEPLPDERHLVRPVPGNITQYSTVQYSTVMVRPVLGSQELLPLPLAHSRAHLEGDCFAGRGRGLQQSSPILTLMYVHCTNIH